MGAAVIVVIIILLLVCASYFSSPAYKGKAGEASLRQALECVEGHKCILQNCYIPSQRGGSTEIDLLMVHETGIYVFEVKNYTGWIFGDENQEQWLETFPGGKNGPQRYYFLNPMIQNEHHLRCLKQLLHADTIPCYSYIVFGNSCVLKTPDLNRGPHRVVQQREVLKWLRSEISCAEHRLAPAEVDAIGNLLGRYENASPEQKAAHQQRIQWEYSGQFDVRNIQEYGSPLCPWCGAPLVLRVAKTGKRAGHQFWGCSHYPKCRFTRDL